MSQRKVRARDVDRDAAINIVEAAWADGQLTRQEYEQRVDRLLRAATLDKLEQEIVDLQPEGTVWRPALGAVRAQPVSPQASTSAVPPGKRGALVGVLVFFAVIAAMLAFVIGPDDVPAPPAPEEPTAQAEAVTGATFVTARQALIDATGNDTVYSATLTDDRFDVIRPVSAAGPDAVRIVWTGEWTSPSPASATSERLSLDLVSADAVSSIISSAHKAVGADAEVTLTFQIIRSGDKRICITATGGDSQRWSGSYDCRGQEVER